MQNEKLYAKQDPEEKVIGMKRPKRKIKRLTAPEEFKNH
jgi:hypothetical protein